MSPLERYQQLLASKTLTADPEQLRTLHYLDHLYHELTQAPSFFKKWCRPKSPKGLYLWGSVGIGKTVMLDLFFEVMPLPTLRIHFFEFMRNTHQQLQLKQGEKNPLISIAKKIARTYRILCFDELFVSDIADAMVLGELLQYLFSEGVILISTSNIKPDDLYKEGLQRERFLTAIESIKNHTEVIHLATKQDYRQRPLATDTLYLYPINQHTTQQMQALFNHYNGGLASDNCSMKINSHFLKPIQKSETVLWCSFKELCQENRSPDDYLDLAHQFHTILIDNITTIKAQDEKSILRFIHLIDVLYDQHIRVIISAETTIDDLYPTGPHRLKFQRTRSRLLEMQASK